MIQRVFQGPNRAGWKLPDMTSREAAIMAAMIVIMVWLGLYPQPVLDTAAPALDHLQRTASRQRPRHQRRRHRPPSQRWTRIASCSRAVSRRHR